MNADSTKKLTQVDLDKIRAIEAKWNQLRMARMEVRRIKAEIEELEKDVWK